MTRLNNSQVSPACLINHCRRRRFPTEPATVLSLRHSGTLPTARDPGTQYTPARARSQYIDIFKCYPLFLRPGHCVLQAERRSCPRCLCTNDTNSTISSHTAQQQHISKMRSTYLMWGKNSHFSLSPPLCRLRPWQLASYTNQPQHAR